MTESPTVCYARLRIFGQCNPDVLLELLQLAGSEIWREGDLVPKTILRMDDSGWTIRTEEFSHGDVGCAIESLLQLCREKTDRIKVLAKTHALQLRIVCAVTAGEVMPTCFLSNQLLREITLLGAELDVDIIQW